jgi:hypothetical protein
VRGREALGLPAHDARGPADLLALRHRRGAGPPRRADGLTVGGWFPAILLAAVVAFGLALAHHRLFGRHTPDDE